MSHTNKCGGCKHYLSYPDRNNILVHECHRHFVKKVSPREPKCQFYKPVGFEPTDGVMSYAEFVVRCREFYYTKLKPIGYVSFEVYDQTATTLENPKPDYHFEVSRRNPRSGNVETVLLLDFCPDIKSVWLYENFAELNEIPQEYGDMRNPNLPDQPPQFIYGTFSRLGDALNSMLKGCSIDLRKPKELFY